jgi:hypothetical protein
LRLIFQGRAHGGQLLQNGGFVGVVFVSDHHVESGEMLARCVSFHGKG